MRWHLGCLSGMFERERNSEYWMIWCIKIMGDGGIRVETTLLSNFLILLSSHTSPSPQSTSALQFSNPFLQIFLACSWRKRYWDTYDL